MPEVWTLRLTEILRPSVERNKKKIDLRIACEKNKRVIEEISQYVPGDRLRLEFTDRRGEVTGSIGTTITKPTETKPLGDLTDSEIELIGGLLNLTRGRLMDLLREMYSGKSVDDDTNGRLVHFAR